MSRQLLRALTAAAGILLGVGVVTGSAANLSLTSQNFTPYRTCTITATPATTTAVSDTTARQGTPTTNFGALTTLTVSSGNAVNQRVYLRFDLTVCSPAIPASAIVRLATLRLYMSAVPAACRTLNLFPVTAAWVETTLTWNNQPFGTTLNNPPTGSRTGTFNVGTPVGCQNQAAGYVAGGTVTADIANFVAGTATNFGWMIRDDTEGSATTRTATFTAKELGTVAQEPQLVITYVRVP
ncbi:MAG: DNRLRE domain-containing protein [Chloroflexi bacterium]|nr:DNRLRE domain-containing protein [Chloroflexota bacterium]